MEIRSVLVPTDFSEASTQALAHGKTLAQQFDAALCVVHIIPLSIPTFYAYPVPSDEWQKSSVMESENRIRKLVSDLGCDLQRCRVLARCGHIDEEILNLVGEANIDLIVMGAHGRRTFQRWFLGSITENILRKAPVPVLTVTHTEEAATISAAPFKRILAATDLSPTSGLAVDVAAALARIFESQLTVLHVLEDGQETPPDLSAIALSHIDGVDVSRALVAGTPHEVIVRYAEEASADLIVLTLQGKGFLHRSLLGTTAERVIRSTRVPVLSLPRDFSISKQIRTGAE